MRRASGDGGGTDAGTRAQTRREDGGAGTIEKNRIDRVSQWLGGCLFFSVWILDIMDHVNLSGGLPCLPGPA